MDKEKRRNFENAFDSRSSGCRGLCACGVEYYDVVNQWDWDEGEFDSLVADPSTKPVDHAVGYVLFGGGQYVNACDCWIEEAERVVKFLENHSEQITEYLKLEKNRRLYEASQIVIPDSE